MALAFFSLSDLLFHGFDDVIDVRSPAEFAEDHVPGAINLPALTNEERAEVGTIYVQDSPFNARKIGAALVARNVAAHLETSLNEHNGSWRPLVYCWRGGQRSGSFASILSQIGWRAETIDGGYQSYRRLVHDALYESTLSHRVILLEGNTGTAKTDLLLRLGSRGIQVLDLEGMAEHRGSLLGGRPEGQPSQKAFESAIACKLAVLDPARPVVIEAESSKIGSLIIPPSLWSVMKSAPRIAVAAPVEARAAYLTEAYSDMIADKERLTEKLKVLERHRGRETVGNWLALLNTGDHLGLAQALMVDHYDPSYAKSRASDDPVVLRQFETNALLQTDRDALADQIAEFISAS